MSAPKHPVTEFAFLNLVPPTTLETPELISGFRVGAPAQSSWSGYLIHFFYSTRDSKAESDSSSSLTTIYLISGWESAEAHRKWIVSRENQEIMKSFGDAGLITVGGLAHLDIDFTKLSFEECAAIVWRKRDRRDGGDNGAFDAGLDSGLGQERARKLWSYSGRVVDEGAIDEYQLTGYSEGKLEEFGEGHTVIRKWNLDN
ncbi:hypothetical protein AN958_00702 [Leucoagaricus sp. SymC.cos]|nr:hypothetical protein AN958_00702 [Leucoagaricus sp. SymC.cos]